MVCVFPIVSPGLFETQGASSDFRTGAAIGAGSVDATEDESGTATAVMVCVLVTIV